MEEDLTPNSAKDWAIQAMERQVECIKRIRMAIEMRDFAEVSGCTSEFLDSLADIKVAVNELHRRNEELQESLDNILKTQDIRSQLKREGNAYVPVDKEVTGYGAGPFCMNCMDADDKLIQLHHVSGASGQNTQKKGGFITNKWRCPVCENIITMSTR